MAKFETDAIGAMFLSSLVQVTESISGSVVPLAMFLEKVLNCGWVGVKSLKILVRIQCHVYMAYLTILSILFVHVSDQFPEICGRFRTFWKVVGVGGWGDNLHTSEHTLDVLLFFSNLSSLILFFRHQTNMETEKPLSSCG